MWKVCCPTCPGDINHTRVLAPVPALFNKVACSYFQMIIYLLKSMVSFQDTCTSRYIHENHAPILRNIQFFKMHNNLEANVFSLVHYGNMVLVLRSEMMCPL